MCALEKHVQTSITSTSKQGNEEMCDEMPAIEAAKALQELIDVNNPSSDQISNAIDGLERLRARLSTAQKVRRSLREHMKREMMEKSEQEEHLKRLDSDIIEAKMKVGETLAEKDTVARDLIRARRNKERLNELEREMRLEEKERENMGLGGMSEEEYVLRMENLVKEEMIKLHTAQNELGRVEDDLEKVRLRCKDLQEKIKVAQDEW